MTNWQWSVILALCRCMIKLRHHVDDEKFFDDIKILHDATSRDAAQQITNIGLKESK